MNPYRGHPQDARNQGLRNRTPHRHPHHVGPRTVAASAGAGLLAAMIALPAGATAPNNAATVDPSVGVEVAAPAIPPAPAPPAKPLINPVAKVKYSAHFGDGGHNWSSGKHTGLDFVVKDGTDVMAAAAGVVVKAGPAGPYGNAITIKHDNSMKTMYAHLSKIKVKVGQQVSVGELIGRSGATGNTTGPHLHFEVVVNKSQRDPEKYL
jgi:murein DD-endopeptidase MepM/ murein hydrolase activator NlpD